MIKSLIKTPGSISKVRPDNVNGVIVTIRFIPDESTEEAMKKFEVNNFSKKIDSISKMISGHKLVRF